MNGSSKKSNNRIVPALLMAGGACGLLPSHAAALELGPLQVQSTLGQPLRASIAYALNPNEQLQNFCISLRSGAADDGLQYLSRARISVTDTSIVFTGEAAIREPMLAMRVSVRCPYTAHLARSYTLMIDPAKSAEPETAVTVRQARETAVTEVGRTPAARRPASPPARVQVDRTPIPNAGRYRVQPGDSLSAIVLRIADRPAGLWPSVDAIFAANPHAFIDGDRNLLKAGSWLDIPDLHRATVAPPVAKPEPVYEPPAAETGETVTADARYEPPESTEFDSGFTRLPEEIATPLEHDPPAEETAAESDTVQEIKPGDVFIGSDSPFVSPIENTTPPAEDNAAAIGDGNEAAPDRAVPVVVTSRSESSGASSDGWSWLVWMVGSGVAIILGLLLFARRMRSRFGSVPFGARAQPVEERREPEAGQSAAVVGDVDFQFDDATPAIDAISLDADLGAGTGLQESHDIDVAQDFGFTATTGEAGGDVDLAFPEHAALPDDSGPTTEIIPPNRADESSILENEIPPSDEETGDYDLSMIVDATRQSLDHTSLTAKDLNAVQIAPGDEDDDSGQYTLNKEVDYEILEQDYEEEMTQTQALNEEIAKAAVELAATMDTDAKEAETAEVPAVNPADLDTGVTREMTAQLPPAAEPEEQEELSDLDDTGVNEELTPGMPGADDVTAQMPVTDDEATALMPSAQEDGTAGMPAAVNDPTAEMEVEGGRVDTKKSVG